MWSVRKKDKRRWHKRARAMGKTREFEDRFVTDNDASDVWGMSKDGKSWLKNKDPKWMRK